MVEELGGDGEVWVCGFGIGGGEGGGELGVDDWGCLGWWRLGGGVAEGCLGGFALL